MLAFGIPIGCVLLTLLFAVIVFPYDRFADSLEAQLQLLTGADVEVGGVSGGFSLGGPALNAQGVKLRWTDGTAVELTRASVRPAWSISWLRGEPALALRLESPAGKLAGTGWLGAERAFDGELDDLDLGGLPEAVIGKLPLTGRGDAQIELRVGENGPLGQVSLELKDGSLSLPDAAFAIPYERLAGQLLFAEGGAIELRDVSLGGPAVSLTAVGSIGAAPSISAAPLDLDVSYEVVDPSLRPLLASQGARLDAEGRGRVRVSGTAARPTLQ